MQSGSLVNSISCCGSELAVPAKCTEGWGCVYPAFVPAFLAVSPELTDSPKIAGDMLN